MFIRIHEYNTRRSRFLPLVSLLVVMFISIGCSSLSWLPSSGPSSSQVVGQKSDQLSILVIDVTADVTRRLLTAQKTGTYLDVWSGQSRSSGLLVGPGDVLEISIWEAPPAMLFGATMPDKSTSGTSHAVTIPEQMVAADGTINIPFGGAVPVASKTPQQIEAEIVRRLVGKANQPQVLARVTHNVTANVNVVGEVGHSVRMGLTAKGERLLDALSAAGGVRQPVDKVTIQLSRNGTAVAMPLDAIIQEPKQNILLEPDDVVTALHQPLSFIALGATAKNEEISFEAKGITLAQALGRVGGIPDFRADAQGVFVFRFEELSSIEKGTKPLSQTPEGKVPVVYRVDLKDPRSFLVAQNFPMRNKDVLYVANAPAVELQKFLGILNSLFYSTVSIENISRQMR